MMIDISLLKKKLILGGVLCVVVLFLTPFTLQAIDLGGFIDKDSVIFYTDSNDRLRVHFDVITTFKKYYKDRGDPFIDLCITLNYNWYEPQWIFISPNFDTNQNYGFIVQSLDFAKADDCDGLIETYVAGNSYDVFLSDSQANGLFYLHPDGFIAGNTGKLIKDYPDCDNSVSCPYDISDYGYLRLQNIDYDDDLFYWEAYIPSLTIDYPVASSEIISSFTMDITYDKLGTNFNRLMIIFEDWHASSTCPEQDDPDYWHEYSELDYFNYQSLPFFSPELTATSGTTTIAVSDLPAHNYNCVRCHFINEYEATISGALCPAYSLNVVSYVYPPEIPDFYFPITDWTGYYDDKVDKWATSTALFESWADTIQPAMQWVGNLAVSFKGIFNASSSAIKGQEYGQAIPIARGYLKTIDNFFSGLPVSTIFLFYLITALVVIIFKMIVRFISLIKPI